MRRIAHLGLLVILASCGSDARKEEPKAEVPVAARPDAGAKDETVEPATRADSGVARVVKDKPDAAPGDEVPDVAEVGPKMIAFFEEMTVVAKAAKGDCERIAATFTAMFEEQEPLLKQAGKIEKDRDAEKEWKEEFGEKTGEIRKELAEALKPCAGHDKMAEFFDSV